MKHASVTEAKNGLSALIDGLSGGSPVVIVDRGRPVARLEPVGGDAEPDERLARLVRGGLVRPPRSKLPLALLRAEPPTSGAGKSALAALLEERREGR